MADDVLAEVLPAHGVVESFVRASASSLWKLVSDPSVPARFSGELREARFVDGVAPGVGAVIEGRNENHGFEWTTRSTVDVCEPPTRFSWVTGDPLAPTARWSFEVETKSDGCVLTHRVTLESGESPLRWAILEEPLRAVELVDDRLGAVLRGMRRTVEGITSLAERGA